MARLSSAKAATAVRIRTGPLRTPAMLGFFCIHIRRTILFISLDIRVCFPHAQLTFQTNSARAQSILIFSWRYMSHWSTDWGSRCWNKSGLRAPNNWLPIVAVWSTFLPCHAARWKWFPCCGPRWSNWYWINGSEYWNKRAGSWIDCSEQGKCGNTNGLPEGSRFRSHQMRHRITKMISKRKTAPQAEVCHFFLSNWCRACIDFVGCPYWPSAKHWSCDPLKRSDTLASKIKKLKQTQRQTNLFKTVFLRKKSHLAFQQRCVCWQVLLTPKISYAKEFRRNWSAKTKSLRVGISK